MVSVGARSARAARGATSKVTVTKMMATRHFMALPPKRVLQPQGNSITPFAALAPTLISARVGQAQLVSSFMDALLSDDARRRNLAVEAVLIVLPEDGPKLVSAFEEGAPTGEKKDSAKRSRGIDSLAKIVV
jgi:hypothetical protein